MSEWVSFSVKCNVDPELDCREGRLVYQTECLNCAEDPAVIEKSVYIGTSGHLLHKRNLEHMGDIRRGNMSNALSKHHRLMHNNIEPKFSSRSLRGGIQYNLDRFILEGHKINQASLDTQFKVLNSRSEWGHRGIPRLIVQQ